MKKIKAPNNHKTEAMDLKKKIILFSAIGVVALAMLIIIVIENQAGRVRIVNNTDLKLEYVRAYFVDAEGMVGSPYEYENIEADTKETKPLEIINLLGAQANFEIRFKFENYDELFVDAGYFNEKFKGKINITFDETDEDGRVTMRVKASNGVLPSNMTICDEEYNVYYKEGTIPD